MDNKKYVPVEIIAYKQIESDNIKLIDLFKIITRNKKFIFYFIVTAILGTYIYIQTVKPIYELKFNVNMGYYLNNSENDSQNKKDKIFFLQVKELSYLIKYKYDKTNKKEKYPQVNIKVPKNSNILNISIKDYSNKEAEKIKNKIMLFIQKKENFISNKYIDYINKQIELSKVAIKQYKKNIIELNNKLDSISDPTIKSVYLSNIQSNKNSILDKNSYIENEKLLLNYVVYSKIIGAIDKSNKPIKPNKVMIILMTFISSLIFAIIVVFIIEYIRSIKKESCKNIK